MFMAVGGDVICGVCNGNSGDDADCDQQCRDRGLDVGVCITLPPGLQVGAYLCVCRNRKMATHSHTPPTDATTAEPTTGPATSDVTTTPLATESTAKEPSTASPTTAVTHSHTPPTDATTAESSSDSTTTGLTTTPTTMQETPATPTTTESSTTAPTTPDASITMPTMTEETSTPTIAVETTTTPVTTESSIMPTRTEETATPTATESTSMPTTTESTTATPTTTAIVSPFTCEDGWTLFRTSCYILSDSSGPMVSNCARSNAEHVSIGDAAENAFVHKFHMDQRGDKGCASEASCQLFLGLIRTLNAQGWQWLDGTQYDGGSYKNWALGEPNNFSGHDNCVVMTDDGTWNDIHCHGPRMWLCEKDAKASTTPPTSTATVPTLICEEGWSLFSESCYFLGIGVSPLLKSNCEGRNAHQVTIGDAAENAFVHQYHLDGRGGNGCFGGPSCTLFLGLFRSANAFGWGWADGTPYDGGSYKKWALGEPNNNGGAENCVEMRDDGTWNDASCNSERMWMCEKGASTTTPTTTTSTTATTTPTTPSTTTVTTYSCESGWTHSGQSCYRITNYYGPYANHLIACQAMTGGKGHAATISDNLENFVVLITARGSRASIGCTAVPGCHTYIGLNRVPAGSGPFQWADGRTLGYTNWNANEPNNAGGTENCVEMNDDGTWNDLDCNTNRLFVCEVAATATHSG